jgi:hypothetical protein
MPARRGQWLCVKNSNITGVLACVAAALTVSVAAVAQDSSSGGGKVYRWTDDKGVVHYGDSVPTEYSHSERSVLNNQGVEVGHIEGSKNAQQQADMARAAVAAQQHAQHDQFLLATYLSTKDIEQLRDERVALMEAQVRSATTYIDTLTTRLTALQDRATRFKPYSSDATARRMPDELAEELVHTLNEARTQHQALDSKRNEIVETRAQFDSDIQRYRELTARHN